ncbi:MAG: short chain dehydrogenase [Gammaproteobacteria bacterium CG22_combo_CG10-13_8_21_14_all_40_8]|nr:MAG: short chain dehydrogenase [Gammaproteobacteria bacterium CG22_combo_CG10-13_8_21_14_all_40_8]
MLESLKGLTVFITGASRGIGEATALKCAQAGANVVVAAKTSEPHPKLPGTIHTVAQKIEDMGGKCLSIQLNVRHEDEVIAAFEKAAKHFGGIDILINNAGAIQLTPVEATDVKRYDLMQSVNSRAVYLCSRHALPYLKKSTHGHILSMCPPISLDKQWLASFSPYTISKYGMTLLSLGMAEEFKKYKIAVNCLWPKTTIATAAIKFAVGDEKILEQSRTVDIMADAAYEIIRSAPKTFTGHCCVDETILRDRGVTDFNQYLYTKDPHQKLRQDLFISW